MYVDACSETVAYIQPDTHLLMKHPHRSRPKPSWWYGIKPFSCHVIVIPFHRSPCKRYMQYFYQQFRLCHRDNHGESSGILIDFCFVQCVNVLSIPQPAGPPVNVTCNIFINSFGSIAETTMVSWALCLAMSYSLALCSGVKTESSCLVTQHNQLLF